MVNHVIRCSSCGEHYDFRITHNCKELAMSGGMSKQEFADSLDGMCNDEAQRLAIVESRFPTKPGIELLPGESLDDAITRLAAGLPKPEGDSQSPGSAPGTKKESTKKEPKVTVSDPNAGAPVQGEVHAAFHVYQRRDDKGNVEPENVVRATATRERKMHGPGVLVFCHIHSFGEDCTPACRERISA